MTPQAGGDAARKVYTLWRGLLECRDAARVGVAAARYVAGTGLLVVGTPSAQGPRLTVIDGPRPVFVQTDSDVVLHFYGGQQ